MPTFDREAAKRAGWSDADIRAAIAQGPPSGGPSQSSDATRVATPEQRRPVDYRPYMLEALPVAGSMLGAAGGAMLGAPAGPAALATSSLGAAGGAMVGEGLKQFGADLMGLRGDEQVGPDWGDIGMAGLTYGVGEGVGGAAVGLSKGLARDAMKAALRPTSQAQNEAMAVASRIAGQRVSPHEASMAQQALDEAINIGPGPGGAGSKKLRRMVGEQADLKNAALADAGAQGVTFSRREFTQFMNDLRTDIGKGATPDAALKRLEGKLSEFMERGRQMPKRRGGIGKDVKYSPQEADELKQAWQDEATPAYRAKAARKVVPKGTMLSADFSSTVARGARRAIEDKVPGVKAPNQRMSELKPLEEAIIAAEKRLEGSGSGQGYGILERTLLRPDIASRAANVMNSPAMAATLQQVPRAAVGLARASAMDHGLTERSRIRAQYMEAVRAGDAELAAILAQGLREQ